MLCKEYAIVETGNFSLRAFSIYKQTFACRLFYSVATVSEKESLNVAIGCKTLEIILCESQIVLLS